MTVKLCKDCKFFKKDWASPFTGRFAKCKRTDTVKDNLITGRGVVIEKRQYCSIEREYESLCGPAARYFEEK